MILVDSNTRKSPDPAVVKRIPVQNFKRLLGIFFIFAA